VALLGGVWLAYAGGGARGSFCDRRIALWSLLVPLAMLLLVIVRDLARPLEL